MVPHSHAQNSAKRFTILLDYEILSMQSPVKAYANKASYNNLLSFFMEENVLEKKKYNPYYILS